MGTILHGMDIRSPSNPNGVKMSPAPNWRAIFSVHYELNPPGYDEIILKYIEKPYVKPKAKEKEEAQEKKKKKKLGRNQTL
jgi:hypothetical protein